MSRTLEEIVSDARDEAHALERLACYDRAAAALRAGRLPGPCHLSEP